MEPFEKPQHHGGIVNYFQGATINNLVINGNMNKAGTENYNNSTQGQSQQQNTKGGSWVTTAAEYADYEEADDDCHQQKASKNADIRKETNSKRVNCFKFPSEFTRLQLEQVVKAFYHGEHADLALIEVVCYDHGQLKKRNAHTAFVKALAAWGMINADQENLKLIVSGIKDKFRRLPIDGYKVWGNLFLNDKNRCIEIGKKLDSSMKYFRE